MPKRLFVLLILLMLVLAACTGAEVDASLAEPPGGVSEAPMAETIEVKPTATSAPTEKVVYEGPQMECTLVSNQQEAPEELVSILSVKENDWVSGPETAAVTIVEYSDFQ